jgi:hypothetical protein
MKCVLRIEDEDLATQAKEYPSVKAATEAYRAEARQSQRHGQDLSAQLYLGSRGEISDYPDFVLSFSPRGSVRRERC